MNKVWKFHNDVDTDQIIASQYLLLPDIEAMKQYTFESLDPDFAKKAQPGDLIVAGENFGCGSSREQAPSDLSAGTVTVDGQVFSCTKLPEYMQNILNAGGLIASLNKEEA